LNASWSAGIFSTCWISLSGPERLSPTETKQLGANAEVVLSYRPVGPTIRSDDKLIGQSITLKWDTVCGRGRRAAEFKGTSPWAAQTCCGSHHMRDYVLTGTQGSENNRRFRWLSIVGRLKLR